MNQDQLTCSGRFSKGAQGACPPSLSIAHLYIVYGGRSKIRAVPPSADGLSLTHKSMPTLSISEHDQVHGFVVMVKHFAHALCAHKLCLLHSINPGSAANLAFVSFWHSDCGGWMFLIACSNVGWSVNHQCCVVKVLSWFLLWYLWILVWLKQFVCLYFV